MPVHDFSLGIIISVEQCHGFGNFPRQTGCEGTERFISEQLTTTELVYGAPHIMSAGFKSELTPRRSPSSLL